jgi:DNA-binding NtrC family response regulator
MVVRMWRITTTTSSTWAPSLRVAEEFGGDIRIVVTDVIMPHKSGPELASALRKVCPVTDFLNMSGYSYDEMTDDPISDEFRLMQRPFQIDQLAGKIREILARRSGSLSDPGKSPR